MGEAEVVLPACSFCLRPSTEVATLVAGGWLTPQSRRIGSCIPVVRRNEV
jgi:hypothetical protein